MLEQMLQSSLLLLPMMGAAALGGASKSMVYIYLLAFDFFKCWGHSNFEFVPAWFRSIPGVKYLLYTPSSVTNLLQSLSSFKTNNISCIVHVDRLLWGNQGERLSSKECFVYFGSHIN